MILVLQPCRPCEVQQLVISVNTNNEVERFTESLHAIYNLQLLVWWTADLFSYCTLYRNVEVGRGKVSCDQARTSRLLAWIMSITFTAARATLWPNCTANPWTIRTLTNYRSISCSTSELLFLSRLYLVSFFSVLLFYYSWCLFYVDDLLKRKMAHRFWSGVPKVIV